MTELLSVNTTFVTIFDYPLSYVEFLGTVLYLWSVYLIAKRNLWTWPVGILSVLLFMALFYQIRLYSAAAEQVYYLAACGYGWWYWSRHGARSENVQAVTFSPPPTLLGWLSVILIFSATLGLVMSRVHEWSPTLFPEAASYPWIDAFTTVMSLVAMWLMARKRIESWVLWILVDVISIGLYFEKGVIFVALLYVILLALAVMGLLGWMRAGSGYSVSAAQPS